MSIDCTLLPYAFHRLDQESLNDDMFCFSITLLPLQTNSRDLFDKIEELSKTKYHNAIDFIKDGQEASGIVEPNFTSYIATDAKGESCYGVCTETAYGGKMRWVRVSLLLQLKDHKQVKDPRYGLNKAAWAYLEALPKDLKIAIYWH